MITIEDKTYRNLEEQVQWLTDIILQAVDVVKNVVGKVPSVDNLPSANLYNPGDTFAVGSSQPFAYYTQIGGTWVDMGTFPLAGPAGADGADGYNLYFSSASLTGSSTSVSISTFNNPESHTVNVGDFVIGGTDILLFIITSISAGIATILYKGQLKGPTGADGYSIFNTSSSVDSTTTAIGIPSLTNPAGKVVKAGDVIIGGSAESLFIVTNVDSYQTAAFVSYVMDLKGAQGAPGADGAPGAKGANGYAIYYSSEDLTSSSTTAFTIKITNPSSLDYKIGDLLIGGSDSNLFEINDLTNVITGWVGIRYITKLKGDTPILPNNAVFSLSGTTLTITNT